MYPHWNLLWLPRESFTIENYVTDVDRKSTTNVPFLVVLLFTGK